MLRPTHGAHAAATTMLLFGNDSHHTAESAVQRVAFTFSQKTVSVFASPVSSNAYVKAFLPASHSHRLTRRSYG